MPVAGRPLVAVQKGQQETNWCIIKGGIHSHATMYFVIDGAKAWVHCHSANCQKKTLKRYVKTLHRSLKCSHVIEKFIIAFAKVAWNLCSILLWIAIGVVFVVANVLKNILFGVGLAIGDVAEFSEKVVAVIFEVINVIANSASETAHGAKDFFTFHWSRLSHEGDYITRTDLQVPPVLSQLARLKTDIKKDKDSSIVKPLVQMIQLISHAEACPALDYFRTISHSRWTINGFVDVLLPELCTNSTPEGIQVVMFLFDGLPSILSWIGTTGIVLWIVFIECWPLVWFCIVLSFEILTLTIIKLYNTLQLVVERHI